MNRLKVSKKVGGDETESVLCLHLLRPSFTTPKKFILKNKNAQKQKTGEFGRLVKMTE